MSFDTHQVFLGLPRSDFVGISELDPTGHIRLKAPTSAKLEEAVAPVLASLGLANLLTASTCFSTGTDCGGHGSAHMLLKSRELLDEYYADKNTKLLQLLHLSEFHDSTESNLRKAASPPVNWPFRCSHNGAKTAPNVEQQGEICYGLEAFFRIVKTEAAFS